MERRIEACLKHDQEKKFTLKTRWLETMEIYDYT